MAPQITECHFKCRLSFWRCPRYLYIWAIGLKFTWSLTIRVLKHCKKIEHPESNTTPVRSILVRSIDYSQRYIRQFKCPLPFCDPYISQSIILKNIKIYKNIKSNTINLVLGFEECGPHIYRVPLTQSTLWLSEQPGQKWSKKNDKVPLMITKKNL